MHSLKLFASSSAVDFGMLTILVPHGPCAFFKLELRQSLTKAKNVFRVDFDVDLCESFLVDEGLAVGVDHGLARSGIGEGE